jgi:N-acetylmuramoyl-L-alanine amidase
MLRSFFYYLFTGALFYLAACFLLTPAVVAGPLFVKSVFVDHERSTDHVHIQLNKEVTYSAFLLDAPSRLVVDLPPFRWQADTKLLANYHGTLVKNIRYARFNDETSRIVFDLTAPVTLNKISAGPTSEVLLSLTSAGEHSPVTAQPANEKGQFSVIPLPITKPEALGRWEKPVIVIDAGHGGKDTGAIGRGGSYEKHIVLEYARDLAEALIDTGEFHARLTRKGDYFILLRDRVKLAREAKADIFLSLHADSAPSIKARGLSVYTLSEEASDKEAAALAERENKAGILEGVDLTHENKDVANILIDLAQRDTKNKSIILADHVVESLDGQITLLPNTHRYAGFAVLTAPDIPSALIEVGFLSHPKEEYIIQKRTYRKKVIEGIVRGLQKYFAAQTQKE